jgi:hypothetical protein
MVAGGDVTKTPHHVDTAPTCASKRLKVIFFTPTISSIDSINAKLKGFLVDHHAFLYYSWAIHCVLSCDVRFIFQFECRGSYSAFIYVVKSEMADWYVQGSVLLSRKLINPVR